LRKDHRPYFIKKAYLRFEKLYVRHFLKPHLEHLGDHYTFVRPWHVRIFGSPIEIGDFSNIIGATESKVKLSVWSEDKQEGGIKVGDYCLICPGVRISSAYRITIGNNCMFAHGAFVTDADWHGVYDRVSIGKKEPIVIENNVWVGDSAIICKGVVIGENSIIGAGAVVTASVPPNAIAAGNPARIVRQLDPNEKIRTRDQWLSNFFRLSNRIDRMEQKIYRDNTLLHYIRYLIWPKYGD
jgi:acetyltransferase-like isoleucine patch superfamily enzyme